MVELLVALVLLAVVLVGMQTATAKFVRVVATSDRQAVAAQIAEARIERVRIDPNYDLIDDHYEESPTSLPDPPGFTRETAVTLHYDSTDAGVTEFKRVTVTVDGPGLVRPLARTISVARP